MSVSRDFIDPYSPEAPTPRNSDRREPGSLAGGTARAHGQCGATTLVFGFHAAENSLKALISLPKTGCFFLTLGQEGLQRAMQADRLVHLGARSGPVGAEPDQLLHVRIGRHDLPRLLDAGQIGGIGGPRHGPRDGFEHVDGRIAAAFGDGPFHDDMAVEDAAYRVGDRLVVVVALD